MGNRYDRVSQVEIEQMDIKGIIESGLRREIKKTIEKLVEARCESLIKQDYNRICEKITDEITKSKLVKK